MNWLILLALLKKLDKKIDDLETVTFKKVDELPATGEANVIYFVPKETAEEGNYSDEYIWDSASESYEQIGDSMVDYLPEVTAADNGKLLGVANGKWGKVSLPVTCKIFRAEFRENKTKLRLDGATVREINSILYNHTGLVAIQLTSASSINSALNFIYVGEQGYYTNPDYNPDYLYYTFIAEDQKINGIKYVYIAQTPVNRSLDNNYLSLFYYAVKDINENIAPTYSKSSTYDLGDLVIYNNNLYECTTAITTAEAWTPAHWTRKNLSEIIDEIEQLPSVTSSDEGKALLVNDQGQWVAGELPEPTPGASWVDLVATLTAGSTSVSVSDPAIGANSAIDIYTDTFGVNPTDVQVVPGYAQLQQLVTREQDLNVTITSTADFDPGSYPKWNAFYVDNSKAWVAANDTANDVWFAVEFPTAVNVDTVQWICGDPSRRSTASYLQYSDDGTNWTNATLDTNESGNIVLGEDITAKHWRLYFTGSFGSWAQPMISCLKFLQNGYVVNVSFDAQSSDVGVKVRVS